LERDDESSEVVALLLRQGISRMNWAWATSLEHIWRSPSFPMWLAMAAAGFFGLIALITLMRAEKSIANGALTVITLLAIGIAVASTIRGYGPVSHTTQSETRSAAPAAPALPALACVDGFAGDPVLAACEKAMFGSAESTAAAVSYAAAQIGRLTALGDVTGAERNMNPELRALRRTIERDRYGLMAQVLTARDRCTPTQCAAFRSLTDSRQIVANMEEHTYDALVTRYAPSWNSAPAGPPVAMLSSMPTGRPTNAEFPTAASTPPVSIMTPEPGAAAQRAVPPPANAAQRAVPPPANTAPSSAANASLLSPRPTSSVPATPPAAPAAKKPAAPKRPVAAPAQIAPPPADPSGASSE
jgi:hypothetical protein